MNPDGNISKYQWNEKFQYFDHVRTLDVETLASGSINKMLGIVEEKFSTAFAARMRLIQVNTEQLLWGKCHSLKILKKTFLNTVDTV